MDTIKALIREILFTWTSKSFLFTADDLIEQLKKNVKVNVPGFMLKRYIASEMKSHLDSYTRYAVTIAGHNYLIYGPMHSIEVATSYKAFSSPLTSDTCLNVATIRVPQVVSYRVVAPVTRVPEVLRPPYAITKRELKPKRSLPVYADNLDRLVIPKRVLSYAGFKAEEDIFIKKIPSENKVIVSKVKEDGDFIKRSVTKRGMVRIAGTGLNTKLEFDARAGKNRVFLVGIPGTELD